MASVEPSAKVLQKTIQSNNHSASFSVKGFTSKAFLILLLRAASTLTSTAAVTNPMKGAACITSLANGPNLSISISYLSLSLSLSFSFNQFLQEKVVLELRCGLSFLHILSSLHCPV